MPERALAVQESGPLTTIEIIAAAARDPQVDPAKLRELMDLHERAEARHARAQFNAAFSRLQIRIPRVSKDGTIELRKDGVLKGKVAYARWEDIDAVLRPLLADEGLSLSFTSAPSDKGVEMTVHLRHVAGHEELSTMVLPPDAGPGRNGLQAIGSSHSYGKRYLACDILNIVTQAQDDDGEAAGYVSDGQLETICTLLSDLKLPPERVQKFLQFARADRVEHIRAADYARCVEALQKIQRQAKP